MLKTRVIPCLLLRDESLVKTVKFDKAAYIGDPINTVRIFNELEVDELLFLDITATNEKRTPNFKILAEIANECFMPLGYGGGLQSFEDAKKIFQIGFEKVAVNSNSFNRLLNFVISFGDNHLPFPFLNWSFSFCSCSISLNSEIIKPCK